MSFIGKMFAKKPTSTNQNMKLLNTTFTPQAQQGVIGSNYLTALLTGQGDVAGANQGLEDYYARAGFQPAMDAMTRSVTGSAAAKGLLRSGSTAKALQREGANLNQQFYNNYLSNLGGLANIGQGAGQILANAGSGSSDSMRPSGAGIAGKLLGAGLSLFSDRRLKQDIVEVGTYPNGLPMYEFSYKGQSDRWRGTMADDVEKVYPEAVFTTPDGFKAVAYSMIGIRMERVDGSA